MKIKKFFDDFSEKYDEFAFKRSLGTRYLDEIERNFIRKLSNKKGDIVLDMGIGTGRNAELLVNKGAIIEGVDISERMMEEAKKKLKGKPVNFKVADVGEEILYPDNTFDCVVCIRVLKYIPTWKKTIREVLRVLKKDGIFVFEFANLYSVAYFGLKNANYRLFKFKDIKKVLEKEGFQIIKIEGGTYLPFSLYKYTNTAFILNILKSIEWFLDKILPKTVLSRNMFIVCKKGDENA